MKNDDPHLKNLIAELKKANRQLKSENKKLREQLKRMSNQSANTVLSQETPEESEEQRLHLEQLISERTHELENKNKSLIQSRKALAYLIKDVNESRAELTTLNEQLESVNQELKAFVYSISHDLRAPLRHINGFIELLIQPDTLQDAALTSKYLDIISKSSIKMGLLIDGLLMLSRIGRSEELIQKFDLNEMISEIIEELLPETKNRDVRFTIAKLPTIEADWNLIKMVFMNIISNAVKFTKNQELALIEIGTLEDQTNPITYFVKDNGAGFNMKYSNKLFGTFQRLHTEAEFEGTGIGLATVQRIINRYRGKIWADSKLGEGSVFYFNFVF